MKYDRLGIEFLKISAFLYAARFIAAALMGPGLKDWDPKLFHLSYEYIGKELTYWAIFLAVVGVLMIVIAFIYQHKTDKQS